MPSAPTSHRKLTAAALAVLAMGAVAIPATGHASDSAGSGASSKSSSHLVAPGRAHVPPAIRDAG